MASCVKYGTQMRRAIKTERDVALTFIPEHILKLEQLQRRLAWPLRKDDTQIREAFQIFFVSTINIKVLIDAYPYLKITSYFYIYWILELLPSYLTKCSILYNKELLRNYVVHFKIAELYNHHEKIKINKRKSRMGIFLHFKLLIRN
uniref:Uncharacterized protein n=1 Tax=Heterorhabditis bacteriophora TaxID=37862 RepID=A0A1I7WKK9_HETBA